MLSDENKEKLSVEVYQDENLVFGYDTAREGDGTALAAGVAVAAVEVHVLGPVGVRHAAAAAKLRSHANIKMEEEKKKGVLGISHIYCTYVNNTIKRK